MWGRHHPTRCTAPVRQQDGRRSLIRGTKQPCPLSLSSFDIRKFVQRKLGEQEPQVIKGNLSTLL